MRLSAEDDLLDWLRSSSLVSELVGDDALPLDATGRLVVSVDQQIAGTHVPADLDPRWTARRLLEVSISDLAACGARPEHAFSTIAAPADWFHKSFLRALGEACRQRGVELAGGDVGRAEGVVLTLLVIGTLAGSSRFVPRSAARPGDRIWSGGSLGVAALGRRLVELGARPEKRSIRLPERVAGEAALHRAARRAVRAHLRPHAQIGLGLWLSGRRRAAAIDVSDGLSLDLARLCRASDVGALLEPSALALDPEMRPLAERLGVDAERAVLAGGEDYVLVFALPPRAEPPARLGCRQLGTATEGSGLVLAGSDRRLEPAGWSHL